MKTPFIQRIASMNSMYKLAISDQPLIPDDIQDRLIKFKATFITMDSNESKLDANGNPIYDSNGKFLNGTNYWKPEPKIKKLLETRGIPSGNKTTPAS